MNRKIFEHTWTLALIIGIFGGLGAVIYYQLLTLFLRVFWSVSYGHYWLDIFSLNQTSWLMVLITGIGGLFVGLCIKFFGAPGEISAVVNNIHVKKGRLDIKETPSMIINSLFSIAAGGSAGPEAPLVQIIGSFASTLGEKLKLTDDKIRQCTFCGMSCALGAFFGAPIGGALFALEIPHRKSIEHGEAIVPSLIAAVVGFLIYRGMVGYTGPIFPVDSLKIFLPSYFMYSLLLAFLGSLAASFFIIFFKWSGELVHKFTKYPVIMGVIGGVLLGLIAKFYPQTLFWGELQIKYLLNTGLVGFSPTQLVAIAFFKIVAVAVTLHFGFRGGFIFPLFFIGGALGLCISHLYPAIPVPLAVLSMMAAMNVSVTKTPLATVVILISLSGSDFLPYLAVVSIASLALTNKISLITTQKSIVPIYADSE